MREKDKKREEERKKTDPTYDPEKEKKELKE